MFESFMDPIFNPLLSINLFLAVTIISLLMSLIITLVYKFVTDQTLMKDLKTELKELQKQMKELRSHPEKMMKVQKKVMETNMKYMMQSMKPTLITFLPIIIIFGWLNANIAYEPLLPNQDFTATVLMDKGSSGTIELNVPEGISLVSDPMQKIVNNEAGWVMKGTEEGVYILEFVYNDNEIQQKEVTISQQKYSAPEKDVKDSNSAFNKIELSMEKSKPLGDISIFGYTPGWLFTYIIVSILFSLGLRKALKIY